MKRNQAYYILFFACIFTRLVTSINYIEDIDSLRFALSLYEYNISNLQPHFPGYPVFCFVVKIIYSVFGNMGVAFSIVGGISTFAVIYFSLKLTSTEIISLEGAFLSFIVFFNPMLWIMSNRYMPDLMGFSIALAALYIFIYRDHKNSYLSIGFFLTGLLCGTRLSYIPIVLIPFVQHLLRGSFLVKVSSFMFGCLIWLIPIFALEGFNELVMAASQQTIGHFTNFGGTVVTNANMFERLLFLIESVWADGMGGFWLYRSWHTVMLSIFIVIICYVGLNTIISNWKHEKYLRRIIRCLFAYFLWIILFQNVIYKSRHTLPLLLLFFIVALIGFEYIISKRSKIFYAIVLLFSFSLMNVTVNLAQSHKKPTAISQLKDNLLKDKPSPIIISTPLINYYLQTHKISSRFLNANNTDEIKKFLFNKINDQALVIGDFSSLFESSFVIKKENTYYHNPYVNRMWSKIETFSISRSLSNE